METWKIYLAFIGALLLTASSVYSDEYTEPADEDEVYEDKETDQYVEDIPVPDSDIDVEEEADVLILTEDNFQDVIDSHDIILVEFYAPWCGHCKKLEPEYEAAAAKLKKSAHPVALAKVDATVQTEIANKFGVSGYPTLKIFKNGQAVDYDGPRNEDGIVEYMKERADPNWKPPPSAVIVLGEQNFTSFVVNEELSLVEFYAPWCGHCKRLEPEYEKAAKELKSKDIPLAKVDATVESGLATEYSITGYPTMMVFRYGKGYEYKGGRDSANDLVTYMSNQKGPATKASSGLKELQKRLNNDDVTVVAFFEDKYDKRFDVYESFSNTVREEYSLIHTYNKETMEHYKVNPGTLMVINAERFQSKYERQWYTMEITEDTKDEELLEFVKAHEIPLVGHLSYSTKTKRYLKEGRKPLVMYFFDVDWSYEHKKATEKSRQQALRLAKDFKDDFTFVIADERENSDYFRDFGFDDSSEDLNVGILSPMDRKYPMEPMEDGHDDELIRDFLNAYSNGKLKPKLKSQRPPKKQGPVTVVVGDTFEKVVMDTKKDVLIEFYAPWCGHCKKLEPKYKELAKIYKKNKNLVIAKMDATGNEYPEQFEVKGYPTMYFAPANDKANPKMYDGAMEVEDLKKFVEENAFLSLESVKKKQEL